MSNTANTHKPVRTPDCNHHYTYREVPVFKTNLSFAKWAFYHEVTHPVSGQVELTRAYAMTIAELTDRIDRLADSGCYLATARGLQFKAGK